MTTRTLLACLLLGALASCSAPTITDPMAELATTPNMPARQKAAMDVLDAADPDEKAYLKSLHRIIYYPGYTMEVREAALERLAERDETALKRTIRQQLPRLSAPKWHARLCEIIVERGWIDLTPALVSSWARPSRPGVDDADRPEAVALVTFYGADHIAGVVFDSMIENDRPSDEGYRTRCWTLLVRLGERDRLMEVLETRDIPKDDGMLIDLRAAALELGIVPRNREEILWIRKLRGDDYAEFWANAVSAAGQLTPARLRTLELRNLPVVVAAALHRPELLEATRDELYASLADELKGRPRHDGGARSDQRLRTTRDALTWGDLAAMHIAIEALDVPQVRGHLFDYARRDTEDKGTEYGGIIDLDGRGRFQVLEFTPRIRHHDQRFNASQAMFDAGYAALFHFHFHVQRQRNGDYAGPGAGDLAYAQNTRTNNLVLTSVGKDRMNVDYYRHTGIVVDLGEIRK